MSRDIEKRDITIDRDRALEFTVYSHDGSEVRVVVQPRQVAYERGEVPIRILREPDASAFGDLDDDLANATWEDAEWRKLPL